MSHVSSDKPMAVRIRTAGRLHLGFMDLNGGLGRLYGSIGVSLTSPFMELFVRSSDHLSFDDTVGHIRKRLSEYVTAFSNHFNIQPRVSFRLTGRIPEHKGLGSGSQLALAVATCLARICHIDASTYELATIMGRGLRSGIGITSFESGGLIIDTGKKRLETGAFVPDPPRAVARYDFPNGWDFVLVIPEEKVGLSGKQEKKAMGFVSPSRKISEEICRLVMIQLLPSLIEQDIGKFGSALSDIDRKTGLFFKPVQGGIYAEKQSYKIIDHMLESGAYGAGQSSWGPAVYGLTQRQESDALAGAMKEFLDKKRIAGDVVTASVRNSGALVEVLETNPGR